MIMKKIFSVESGRSLDGVLLIIRLVIGSFMLVHGLPKLALLLGGGEVQFISILGLGAKASLALAAFAEVFCSVLIIVGLGTRLASIPLIVTMLVAVFYVHANDPFIKQEMGLHYLLVYGLLLVAGSGKYSADYLVDKRYLRPAQAARTR
jgi:putative oxidoreductase